MQKDELDVERKIVEAWVETGNGSPTVDAVVAASIIYWGTMMMNVFVESMDHSLSFCVDVADDADDAAAAVVVVVVSHDDVQTEAGFERWRLLLLQLKLHRMLRQLMMML